MLASFGMDCFCSNDSDMIYLHNSALLPTIRLGSSMGGGGGKEEGGRRREWFYHLKMFTSFDYNGIAHRYVIISAQKGVRLQIRSTSNIYPWNLA